MQFSFIKAVATPQELYILAKAIQRNVKNKETKIVQILDINLEMLLRSELFFNYDYKEMLLKVGDIYKYLRLSIKTKSSQFSA